MVIDKSGIVNGIYKGRAVAANSIIAPSMKAWYNDKLKPWVVDVKAAKELLKSKGYEWDAAGKLMYPAGKTETLKSSSRLFRSCQCGQEILSRVRDVTLLHCCQLPGAVPPSYAA